MAPRTTDDRTPTDIREDLGLSPQDLCASAGITLATLRKIEGGGKGVTVATLERVGEVLGLSASALLASCERARANGAAR